MSGILRSRESSLALPDSIAITIESIGALIAVLALLILALEVNIRGHWPWQRTSLIGDTGQQRGT